MMIMPIIIMTMVMMMIITIIIIIVRSSSRSRIVDHPLGKQGYMTVLWTMSNDKLSTYYSKRKVVTKRACDIIL